MEENELVEWTGATVDVESGGADRSPEWTVTVSTSRPRDRLVASVVILLRVRLSRENWTYVSSIRASLTAPSTIRNARKLGVPGQYSEQIRYQASGQKANSMSVAEGWAGPVGCEW